MMRFTHRSNLLLGRAMLGVAASMLLGAAQSQAAVMAYDPFLAGGASPNTAAGEYETGTGYANDDIIGQAPTVLGFVADPWESSSSYASSVYYRTEDAQLEYLDAHGLRLTTTTGQLNLSRTSGSSSTTKQVSRDLSIGTSLPEELYVSVLVQFTDGTPFEFVSAAYGYEAREFSFGINTTGNPYVTGSGTGSGTDTNTGVTVSADEAHFLVAKLTNGGTTNDQIDLYLDPLLYGEGLNTPVATIDVGNFYVAGNSTWSLLNVLFESVVASVGESVIVDEVRIGSTWADVTVHTPEPSTVALALSGVVTLAWIGWRRRRRAA